MSVALALRNFEAWFSWVFHTSAHPSSPVNPSHATQPHTLFTPPYQAPTPHDLVLLRSAGVRAAPGRLQQPRAWRPPPAPVEAKFQSERSPTWPTKSKSNVKGSSEWQGCGIDHVALAPFPNMNEKRIVDSPPHLCKQILPWTSLYFPFNLRMSSGHDSFQHATHQHTSMNDHPQIQTTLGILPCQDAGKLCQLWWSASPARPTCCPPWHSRTAHLQCPQWCQKMLKARRKNLQDLGRRFIFWRRISHTHTKHSSHDEAWVSNKPNSWRQVATHKFGPKEVTSAWGWALHRVHCCIDALGSKGGQAMRLRTDSQRWSWRLVASTNRQDRHIGLLVYPYLPWETLPRYIRLKTLRLQSHWEVISPQLAQETQGGLDPTLPHCEKNT